MTEAPDTSAMLPRFGPLYLLAGAGWFFRHLRMEEHSRARVETAARNGPVVYVLHTRSMVDWLALNRVLVDHRLPLPTWTNGISATPWMPLGAAWRALRGEAARTPDDPLAGQWLAKKVASGEPVCLFLSPARDLRDLVVRREEVDPLPALIEAQSLTDRPIQVLPVVVLWDKAPEGARTEVGRFLLGTADNPGALGKLWTLAASSGDALVQVGEPIALAAYAERYRDEPAQRRLRAMRLVLRRYLYREARVVRGPRSRPFGQVRRTVLESREVRELIARESAGTGVSAERMRARVGRVYDRLAARFRFPIVRLFALACRFIWNRIYSGIDIRPEDLERIREGLRRGTPVLVPAHRSHLDYLLISSLLFDRDIVIPHIVAGENLSFWPLGMLFRSAGAFFVKRSFAEDHVFPVVFERYLRELIRMEVPVEFFIEGGRSRTGKLLPPKLGVLSMVVNAAAEARVDREVSLLPIYIGYEQIAEERVYARELAGARKEKENVGQIMKAARVLTQRYGKVYIRVGEPMIARDLFPEGGWRELPKVERHRRLQQLASRLLHRINQEALALPTALVALAVLAHDRRGLRHTELRERVERLRTFLAAAGVKEGGALDHVDGILEEALGRFSANRLLVSVEEAGERVYSINPDGRTTLEYYKNTVLHTFASAAFYAAAVRAERAELVDEPAVARLFSLQQHLYRYEFVLDPDAEVERHLAGAVATLTAYGALVREGERVRVVDPRRVSEIANLVANFHESYLLVLRALGSKGAVESKEASRVCLAHGKSLLAVGEIVRSEALNLQNIDNALRALTEDRALAIPSEGRLALNPKAAAPVRAALSTLLLLDGGA